MSSIGGPAQEYARFFALYQVCTGPCARAPGTTADELRSRPRRQQPTRRLKRARERAPVKACPALEPGTESCLRLAGIARHHPDTSVWRARRGHGPPRCRLHELGILAER